MACRTNILERVVANNEDNNNHYNDDNNDDDGVDDYKHYMMMAGDYVFVNRKNLYFNNLFKYTCRLALPKC